MKITYEPKMIEIKWKGSKKKNERNREKEKEKKIKSIFKRFLMKY